MKKMLSVLLALVMLFTFALSAVAETASENGGNDEETIDLTALLSGLLGGENGDVELEVSGENGEESVDLTALLTGLLGGGNGDVELEVPGENGEESIDLTALLTGLLGGEYGDAELEVSGENGEESIDLTALLGGLLSGENGEAGMNLSGLLTGLLSGEYGDVELEVPSENGEESIDLTGLLNSLLSSENGEDGEVNLSGLMALFSGLVAGEGAWEAAEDAGNAEYADTVEESYEIYDVFDGTIWESGDLRLVAVFQDGYYKVAITEGDKELSYLCELDEVEEGENSYLRLTGIGTGVEEFDAEQEDHGIATFVLSDEGNIVWQKVDGTEVVFTEVVDPLTTCEWYVDGKMLHITWLGGQDYSVIIDDWTEGYTWTAQVTLDEETDTMTGTESKTQYGDEVYTDGNVSFAFNNTRILLTWKDDREEATADGVTFEMVEKAFTMESWQAENVEDFAGYFTDGKYVIDVTLNGMKYTYVCTYDRDSGILTAADPATLDPENFSEPENLRSSATFVLLEDDFMLWKDDSGATGESGIVLERIK